MSIPIENIRNFCIIAHIDHGKSTLADRMMEMTKTVAQRDVHEQMLDDMDLERERGITIKAHPVTMEYVAKDGQTYLFNLIDTPGHVDFTYEVSRSLSACEGALLVVDAAQGVEAQTVANTYLAMGLDLEIVPILNKIDLPAANIPVVSKQVEDILAIPMDDCVQVSAKSGLNIDQVMEAVVTKIPPPKSNNSEFTRALIFDSTYDTYQGAVSYVRLVDGSLKAGERIRMLSSGQDHEVKQVGIFAPNMLKTQELNEGEVGYMVCNIKDPRELKIGDTVTRSSGGGAAKDPLPGFKEIKPMVYSGIYPVNTADYEKLTASMEKLQLNDSSFDYMPESSVALGLGFRCGFLGLLHMEIITERLRREYDMDIITTYPGVVYQVVENNGTVTEIDNPIFMPDPSRIDHIKEPIVAFHIICDNEHIGDIMSLVRDKRGDLEKTESLDGTRVMLTGQFPLNEILIDFHDKLKSVSRGYASMDYEPAGYSESNLVKMDIMINGEGVDAFSCIVHRTKAEFRGRQMCKSLVEVIPSQMFAVPIQAAIGGKIIARETIRAMRKDVTAKCYGGDITRKRKLLEKQKAGKKKMKQIGKVSIPQEAFISVLKSSN